MRTLVYLVPFLVVGVLAAVHYGLKLRKVQAVEQETQDRAEKASENIKEDLSLKRKRDQLRSNWDIEHVLLRDDVFAGFKHEEQTIGGIIVSCPKCKEL